MGISQDSTDKIYGLKNVRRNCDKACRVYFEIIITLNTKIRVHLLAEAAMIKSRLSHRGNSINQKFYKLTFSFIYKVKADLEV